MTQYGQPPPPAEMPPPPPPGDGPPSVAHPPPGVQPPQGPQPPPPGTQPPPWGQPPPGPPPPSGAQPSPPTSGPVPGQWMPPQQWAPPAGGPPAGPGAYPPPVPRPPSRWGKVMLLALLVGVLTLAGSGVGMFLLANRSGPETGPGRCSSNYFGCIPTLPFESVQAVLTENGFACNADQYGGDVGPLRTRGWLYRIPGDVRSVQRPDSVLLRLSRNAARCSAAQRVGASVPDLAGGPSVRR